MNYEQKTVKANVILKSLEKYDGINGIEPDAATVLHLKEEYDKIKEYPLLPNVELRDKFGEYSQNELNAYCASIKRHLEAFVQMSHETNNAEVEKKSYWHHVFPIFFNSYKSSLFILGILLICTPYIHEACFISSQWKQLQPNLAEAKTILADAISVQKDSVEVVGDINAVITCYNDFFLKIDSSFTPISLLDVIFDNNYDKIKNKGYGKIRLIITKLNGYVDAYSINTDSLKSENHLVIDRMLQIIGLLINIYMLYLTKVQTNMMIRQYANK